SAGAPQPIRLFANNGLDTSPGAPQANPNLLGAAALNEHVQVLMNCDGAGFFRPSSLYGASGAQKSALQTFTSIGGKYFTNHLPGQAFIQSGPAPFSGVSSWETNTGNQFPSGVPAQGLVLNASAPQATMRSWLFNVGAMTDYGS